MSTDRGPLLHTIRVRAFPVDVYRRTSEAFEGLRREFSLIALDAPDSQDVPARLLRLIDALTGEFGELGGSADQERDGAIERGEATVDELVYYLPPAAAGACVALSEMLDEADEFCRQGDVLLSLASTPEAVAFRRWYLGEMVAQLGGHHPLPWPEADPEALVATPALRGTN